MDACRFEVNSMVEELITTGAKVNMVDNQGMKDVYFYLGNLQSLPEVLDTLSMIYTTDELHNPLPRKTMLCEGDMNNPADRSEAFLHS